MILNGKKAILYSKYVFSSAAKKIDFSRIEFDRIDSVRIEFDKIDLCLDTLK
jgi:hypothetical protein